MGKLAAVTGATGFLGRYLVRALASQGWRVRILARRFPVHEQFSGLEMEVVPGDLSSVESLGALVRGADLVVHAAGLVKARKAADFHRVNVEGTAKLVAALNTSGQAARLLLVSSMAAREPQLSAYAASKRQAEDVLRQNLAPRHDWIILRPCAVYGPWDMEILPLFRAANRGVALRTGGKDARICLVHVSDAAGAIAVLAGNAPPRGQYEITDARRKGYRWDEIALATAEALGVRPVNLSLPASLVRLAGGAGSLMAQISLATPMLTLDKAREILHADWGSDPALAPPETLWTPEIPLKCGFLKTVTWYKGQGWL
ncbi:MAG: NAD-dependent epimerase/dehydratase family protein [Pseudomonadota bacterium]